ncbi:hypothetical protein [Micromonospora tarensis]|uniref:Uncharacterized protein n=1 Tax=Micromonospora tarensis TaxID=2806100 RepID=A0ABS1Y9M3_9ACTN|nr:hypothetical protein [Micromonospora tarensis]MBM0274106.1 hypothetical protein [Micromonospora tarensis]
MTQPSTPHIPPGGPNTGGVGPCIVPVVPTQHLVIPVTFKPCCGAVLIDEDCNCAEFITGLFANAPIVLPAHAPGLKALTDPALLGGAA